MLLLASGIFTFDLVHAREFPKKNQCKVPDGSEPWMGQVRKYYEWAETKKNTYCCCLLSKVLHSITKL